MKMKATAVIQL